MRRPAARIPAAVAAVALTLGLGATVGGGVAQAKKHEVGGLSQFGHLAPYCKKFVITNVASTWNISASPSNPADPYSWKCRWPPLITKPIDMNAVCRHYYGRDAYAQVTKAHWAWDSWKCYKG
ncbi:hypothetical protein HUN08_11455 [Gordonia sp. X0973]|uniref:hypothetical protein n=1 Tax=Gordonia sp. X0973 TaxID=2742602 RepID=UPI000F533FAA|nr:hypothetical protein [Gordonia sp. X0973]QKT07736.1 hypothetical protein HUN08_11455 [Gordonia sp. X0973]